MGHAQNIRRIQVVLDLDLARYTRETNVSTLPKHLDAATEAFVAYLESEGFRVQKAITRSTLSYLRYEFAPKAIRGAVKARRHLKKVI